MCFGSKTDSAGDDAPPARPADQRPSSAQQQHQRPGSGRASVKKAPLPSSGYGGHESNGNGNGNGNGYSYGGDASGAGPSGAGQGGYELQQQHGHQGHELQQRDEYAAPSGPPPGRHDVYAAPTGPPPGRQDEYAAPSGPPPGRHDEFAAPVGPPPGRHDEYGAPSGPPPGFQQRDEYAAPVGPPPGRQDEYGAPSGPPPGFQQRDEYAAPSGPPPTQQYNDGYAPPPGPPPAHAKGAVMGQQDDWAAPPPGPPPSHSQQQSQHDWESAVPDTSLFPPPPAIFSGFDRSPSSNAPEEEANAGEDWCQRFPMMQPMQLDQAGRAALATGNLRLIEPAGFNGRLTWRAPGWWECSTAQNSPDRCIISYPPVYLAGDDDPSRTGVAKTVYYEVKLRPDSPTNFLALGFTALPYPSFRMPGWHRGSLAVHGDDGHKYINDRWGGKTFVDPLLVGSTYGIGMTIAPGHGGGRHQVDIFYTCDGVRTGGWDLHEETDAEQDLPVTGLEGLHDLCCAVGTYDGLAFEVVFDPARWLYRDFKS